MERDQPKDKQNKRPSWEPRDTGLGKPTEPRDTGLEKPTVLGATRDPHLWAVLEKE